MFNPEKFMTAEMEAGFETSFQPIDEGEYEALVENVSEPREFQNRDGNTSYVFEITWSLTDPDVLQELERDKATVRQAIFLDIDENGGLARGKDKNVALGRTLEALGVNDKSWSPSSLIGMGPALIKVTQQPDKENPDTVYNRVARVTELP